MARRGAGPGCWGPGRMSGRSSRSSVTMGAMWLSRRVTWRSRSAWFRPRLPITAPIPPRSTSRSRPTSRRCADARFDLVLEVVQVVFDVGLGLAGDGAPQALAGAVVAERDRADEALVGLVPRDAVVTALPALLLLGGFVVRAGQGVFLLSALRLPLAQAADLSPGRPRQGHAYPFGGMCG